MKEIKSVVICGLGAIGGIYAVKLHDFSTDILKVLVDEERLSRYSKNPLIYNGKEYDFDYVLPEEGQKVDLVIVATKSSGLEDAIKNIEKFVGEDTIILSLLNGITSEDEIAKKYGKEKLLYSYFIGHTSTREGRNIDFDGTGKIVFGDKNNEILSENVLSVENLFKKAGINYEIPQDMDYSRWKKFMLNVGANQTSTVLRAVFKYIQNCPKVKNIVISLMREVKEIAKSEGVRGTDVMLEEAIKNLDEMAPLCKTSMFQDISAKRQTEVGIFAGVVSILGRKHNIKTPYSDMIKEFIEAIDEMNKLEV